MKLRFVSALEVGCIQYESLSGRYVGHRVQYWEISI
jgi:hypothetical protein